MFFYQRNLLLGCRPDKRVGNQMKTIFNTMEVIAENV
jgi:hypothetical protein